MTHELPFDELLIQWNWKPIRDCPGRFRLVGFRGRDVLGYGDRLIVLLPNADKKRCHDRLGSMQWAPYTM